MREIDADPTGGAPLTCFNTGLISQKAAYVTEACSEVCLKKGMI